MKYTTSMVLIVLRHGESEWNKENRFTGWTDVGLSYNGIEEALRAGDLISQYNIDYVCVSTLKRAIYTLTTLSDKLRSSNNGVITTYYMDELKERDYGDLTGKNKDELKEMYGAEMVQKWRRSYYERPPNGENLEDVASRAGKCFDKEIRPLLEQDKNVLIVSHGNTLRALFVHLGFYTPENVESFEVSTGKPLYIDLKTNSFGYVNKYELVPYQIIDSRGFPTIEVSCYDKITRKCVGKGSTPSGASCGSNEMLELRDGNADCYKGKSVFKAVNNVISANPRLMLTPQSITNLTALDQQLMALDTSELKTEIGGNAVTAMSFCFADVASKLANKQMFEYIADLYNHKIDPQHLPTPFVNIINGGKHSVTGELKIQEFMIFSRDDMSVRKKTQAICEIYYTLQKLLVERYGESAKAIGDEGGFCPPIHTAEEALGVIEEAIAKSKYRVGVDIFIALDCAASEFYNADTGYYEVETDLYLNGDELIEYYGELMRRHPGLKSIEDGFHESDYDSWKKFTALYSDKIMIVGDDLFTTNKKIIKQGLENGWANTLLLKVNQIGTITEAIEGAMMMFEKGNNVIVSHRSGETNHAYIIDIAIGIGAKYVKIGSPCRGERVAKFNRLLEIEQYLQYIQPK
jgi:enolase